MKSNSEGSLVLAARPERTLAFKGLACLALLTSGTPFVGTCKGASGGGRATPEVSAAVDGGFFAESPGETDIPRGQTRTNVK